MEIVLLKAVELLGPEGAVVKVKSGYARDYLMPKGLAVAATPEQLKAMETAKRQRQQQGQRVLDEATALKQRLESKPVTLKLTLGQDQKAFGSVTTHDIVEALQKEGLTVEKHAVQLDQPIKALGIYEVLVRVHADVTATVKVWVVKA